MEAAVAEAGAEARALRAALCAPAPPGADGVASLLVFLATLPPRGRTRVTLRVPLCLRQPLRFAWRAGDAVPPGLPASLRALLHAADALAADVPPCARLASLVVRHTPRAAAAVPVQVFGLCVARDRCVRLSPAANAAAQCADAHTGKAVAPEAGVAYL
jgi:hypothetical protein